MTLPPVVVASEKRWREVTSDRTVIVRNTAAEVAAAGVAEGTECSLSSLTVKIVANDRVVGVIVVESFEREYAFGPGEVSLLQTIVASMGVALENARLFDETKQALDRQTATSKVLQVISSSVEDVQPVFDAILASCSELLRGTRLNVFLVEGDQIHLGATLGGHDIDKTMEDSYPMPLAGTATERVLRERRILSSSDVANDPALPPGQRDWARRTGYNYSVVMAPLFAHGHGVGSINVVRSPGDAFDDSEQALLKTFADQAGIAIQNARLFNETREALERQTATAEILRVISSSPTDVQPVFDAIVQSCRRLFRDARVGLTCARARCSLPARTRGARRRTR